MKGLGQDLKGTSEVHEVELVVQGEEHIHRLLVRHCTRLGGHLWQLVGWVGGREDRERDEWTLRDLDAGQLIGIETIFG